jgi:hypothetical protein
MIQKHDVAGRSLMTTRSKIVKKSKHNVRRGSGETNRLKSGAENCRCAPIAKIQY